MELRDSWSPDSTDSELKIGGDGWKVNHVKLGFDEVVFLDNDIYIGMEQTREEDIILKFKD